MELICEKIKQINEENEQIYREYQYVEKDHCESSCFGKGCKFLNDCQVYKKLKENR